MIIGTVELIILYTCSFLNLIEKKMREEKYLNKVPRFYQDHSECQLTLNLKDSKYLSVLKEMQTINQNALFHWSEKCCLNRTICFEVKLSQRITFTSFAGQSKCKSYLLLINQKVTNFFVIDKIQFKWLLDVLERMDWPFMTFSQFIVLNCIIAKKHI